MSKDQSDLFKDPSEAAATDDSRGHVMLVEDDAVLRLLLRNSLEDAAYDVLETDSRPETLENLRKHSEIAVMIVDLGLPPVEHTTLEGLALIRTISSEYPAVKIIVLTGQDEEQSAFEAIREGAFDFLSKPARSQDILLAVQRAFLFHRKEQDMLADGHARLQLNTRYADGLKAVREEAEEKLVRQVLKDTGFNVYKTAERLGIKRESIYYFMKKFQISRDDIDLYPYFIIIGSTILAATGWLLHQYRMQVLRSQELIHLNEQLAYDLPDFLRQCWPGLKKGGFTGMSWHLDWFGTLVGETQGMLVGQFLEKTFAVQEIALTLRLHRDKKGWGEQQYFSNALADNFFLLVRMNLWIKLGTVQGTFDQTAKMTVFLKHDVKNMVQLLSLSADQLQSTQDGQEGKLLSSLREAIPAVRDRAEHMLRALGDKPGPQTQPDLLQEAALPLQAILQQAASIYELPVFIRGQAFVPIEKDRLLSIVDNLLGNYSRQGRKAIGQGPELHIFIEKQGNKVITSIEDIYGKPFPWPERLFEPFWSEHGGGRGIGLYQARQQAKAAGGDLTARATADKPLQFSLTLPVAM